MIAAIQAVPIVSAAASAPALGPLTRMALKANALFIVPSVILTLGATAPVPFTYNAAGLFESLLQAAATPHVAASSTAAATANTAGTTPTTASGGSTTLVGDLAALLGIGSTATASSLLDAAAIAPGMTAKTEQALTALLAPDSNPLSAGGAGTLTVSQTLARQMLIDLYPSAEGLDAVTAAGVSTATDILQGLSTNSTLQSIDSLLSTDLGLAAATILDSTGTAATVTTGSDGTWTTTVAPAASSTDTDATPALNATLLGNVDLTANSAPAVSSGTTSTPAKIIASGATIPAAVALPDAAAPAQTIVATPAAAASATATAAVGNAPATVAAAAAVNVPTAASALSNDFFQDAVAQALANIGGNPAYANMVAGLYMSAAIFHSQQAAMIALPNAADSVEPVSAISSVSAVEPVRR